MFLSGIMASAAALRRPTHVPTAAVKQSSTFVTPTKATMPFQRLDHIVLRCRSKQEMLDFYVGVLGAEPEWVGRMGAALSHLRIGSSLIDLTTYVSPAARSMHPGGSGLPIEAPDPSNDAEAGTLYHFAISVAPYDPEEVSNYLSSRGFPPFAQGQRCGADGDGYSIYLRDPENNVLELKCGTMPSPSDTQPSGG